MASGAFAGVLTKDQLTPDQISFTIKKALEMAGPVIIGIPVDYRDNHKFMEIMHPGVLD